MTTGVSIEYAHARASARLSQRPDERMWQHLRASRSVAAQLEAVRSSPAAAYVSGIAVAGTIDAMELAFRQQFRGLVAEVVNWAPDDWKPAISFVSHLFDLPALLRVTGDIPPAWMSNDPELAAFARRDSLERRANLSAQLPWLVAAMAETEKVPGTTLAARPHPALRAWEHRWRALWPACSAEEHASLDQLVRIIERHLVHFGSLAVEDAGDARLKLAAELTSLLRRSAAQPAALFAWLALLAIDLERLRGEFVLRAATDQGLAP
jgi:hypothetical protein